MLLWWCCPVLVGPPREHPLVCRDMNGIRHLHSWNKPLSGHLRLAPPSWGHYCRPAKQNMRELGSMRRWVNFVCAWLVMSALLLHKFCFRQTRGCLSGHTLQHRQHSLLPALTAHSVLQKLGRGKPTLWQMAQGEGSHTGLMHLRLHPEQPESSGNVACACICNTARDPCSLHRAEADDGMPRACSFHSCYP